LNVSRGAASGERKSSFPGGAKVLEYFKYFILNALVILLLAACTPDRREGALAAPDIGVSPSSSDMPAEHQALVSQIGDTPTASQTIDFAGHTNAVVITPERPTPNLQSSQMMTNTYPIQRPYPDAPGQGKVVAAVVEKLAAHLSVPQETIKVVAIRPALWRDSHMGCPSLGAKAAQVIIPGYAILLEANGITYTYHSDETGRQAILCQTAGLGGFPEKTNNPPEALILAAREDLAGSLKVPLEQILFVFAESTTCPAQQGKPAAEGWRLALYAQEKRYTYRVCGDQIIPPRR